MINMLLICLTYILCASVIFLLLWRYKLEKSVEFLKGPKRTPILGSLFDFFGDAEHIWFKLREFNKLYYPLFRFVLPNMIFVIFLDPDDVEALFTSKNHSKKSMLYNLISQWLGEGLLTSFGNKWSQRRKILTPGFHFSILNKYTESFLKNSVKIIEDLKKSKNAVINLETWISEHTLSIICETALGCKSNIFEKSEGINYKKSVDFIGETAIYRVVRPWVFPNKLFSLTSLGEKHKEALKIVHAFSTKIIKQRLKESENKSTNELITENEKKEKAAMLDILIGAYRRGEIDELGIREEVDTFIFEGYDTTAMALIYTILCLSEFKDIQARARDEVNEVWNESGDFGVTEIQKLPYVERVIKETLRLYPSVPIVSRSTEHELELKKFTIPKGVLINVHIYEIHRDPNYWENPEKFDPDRFLPENSKQRHPFAYIPFSGGYRNCIGQKFAMMEMKTTIAYLLRNFYIEPLSYLKDVKHQADLVLRPKNQLFVKFIPINS